PESLDLPPCGGAGASPTGGRRPGQGCRVVLIGAASLDVKARAAAPLIPRTSNHGRVSLSPGGVARNVAENLSHLGVSACLISAVGDDPYGAEIIQRTKQAGVDTSRVLVLPGHRSASYSAVLDDAGDMAVSIDDMHIVEAITPEVIRGHRKLLGGAAMIVVDTNLSLETLAEILAIARRARVPVCADPVSIDLAERLRPGLCGYSIITPNASEASVLCESPVNNLEQAAAAAQKLVSCGVQMVVITLAERGLYYATREGSGHIPAPRVEVVDATGAGDALIAGIVYGLTDGLPLDECMRLGVSAATIALRSAETVSPDLNLERLYEASTA
ncbi:MAG TPA: carbohydrate kinase family protein, partial [Anaeromyxobacteraceae bacterium]